VIDLHIHSNYSDGSDDWRSILKKAESLGLTHISITDHDNCDVYAQMDTPESYFSGEIVIGIEMQACYEKISLELLGYQYDLAEMRELVKKLYLPVESLRMLELQRLYQRCTEVGMRFEPGVLERYDSSRNFFSTNYLHDEMRKFDTNRAFVPDEGSWLLENIFFKRHTSNPVSPFFIDLADIVPSVGQVIDVIHKAGGKVFFPHIYQHEEYADMILNGIVDNYKLDGLECCYNSFTDEQKEYLIDFCQQRGLLISGGSDYHGSYRPKIKMGCSLSYDATTGSITRTVISGNAGSNGNISAGGSSGEASGAPISRKVCDAWF
jgi:predicted metal-dependent phosphoesterase TrpH